MLIKALSLMGVSYKFITKAQFERRCVTCNKVIAPEYDEEMPQVALSEFSKSPSSATVCEQR